MIGKNIPMGRMGDADEFARVALFLASEWRTRHRHRDQCRWRLGAGDDSFIPGLDAFGDARIASARPRAPHPDINSPQVEELS